MNYDEITVHESTLKLLHKDHSKVMICPQSCYDKSDSGTYFVELETDNWEHDNDDSDFYPVISICGKNLNRIKKICNKWAKDNGWKINWL